MWNWLLKHYPVSTVAPLSLLVPVFGILGSVAIFGETVSPQKIAALLLIVAAVTSKRSASGTVHSHPTAPSAGLYAEIAHNPLPVEPDGQSGDDQQQRRDFLR